MGIGFRVELRARRVLCAALLGLAVACGDECQQDFDCDDGGRCVAGRCEPECVTDLDCLLPPACRAEPPRCEAKGAFCGASGRCVGQPSGSPVLPPDLNDGWDQPPGSGVLFVVDSLAIADESRGFDVDGACRGPGDCVDNALWQLGQLGNDQIRQGMLGGESLLLVELAGLTLPYEGVEERLTIKVYRGLDADDPFFPANNFQIPMGETSCCRFLISTDSITTADGVPQARSRVRARIEDGVLRTTEPSRSLLGWDFGEEGLFLSIFSGVGRYSMAARLPRSLDAMFDGLIGGAISINWLARRENPYCKTLNQLCPRQLPDSTMIDLLASIAPPDIDVDGDGLEHVEGGGSGRIELCLDGRSRCAESTCRTGPVVPPRVSGEPWSCAQRPEMTDGYSVGMTFSAIRASVVGLAAPPPPECDDEEDDEDQ